MCRAAPRGSLPAVRNRYTQPNRGRTYPGRALAAVFGSAPVRHAAAVGDDPRARANAGAPPALPGSSMTLAGRLQVATRVATRAPPALPKNAERHTAFESHTRATFRQENASRQTGSFARQNLCCEATPAVLAGDIAAAAWTLRAVHVAGLWPDAK